MLKKFLLAIVFMCFLIVEVSEAADNIFLFDRLQKFSTLSGSFQQKVVDNKNKTLQQASGKIWLERPGNFRWEIEVPDRYLIVADGKNIWSYDVGLEQVTVQPFTYSNTTPAILLGGDVKKIKELFKVSLCLNNKIECYHLQPVKPDMNVKWIEITFDKEKLSTMTFQDQLSQTTTIRFANINLDNKFEGKIFKFEPPEGVDVLGEVIS